MMIEKVGDLGWFWIYLKFELIGVFVILDEGFEREDLSRIFRYAF